MAEVGVARRRAWRLRRSAAGGWGGMGGAPPGYGQPSAQGGRKSYGSGADGGSVVDIDADVKDV